MISIRLCCYRFGIDRYWINAYTTALRLRSFIRISWFKSCLSFLHTQSLCLFSFHAYSKFYFFETVDLRSWWARKRDLQKSSIFCLIMFRMVVVWGTCSSIIVLIVLIFILKRCRYRYENHDRRDELQWSDYLSWILWSS